MHSENMNKWKETSEKETYKKMYLQVKITEIHPIENKHDDVNVDV